MKSPIALFCALALAACASTPKRPAVREASGPTFRLGAEAPFVAFDATGWHRAPGEEKDQLTLHRADHKDARMITVWVKNADPGSKIEAAMTGFAPLVMAVPVLFAEVEATPVEALSDEEALFGFRGVDSKTGTRLTAQFRVKIVSGRNKDYWVMILAFGPEPQAPQMLFDADRIAKSLRIEAPPPADAKPSPK